jgi:polyisoprenoid-binding protein YceI
MKRHLLLLAAVALTACAATGPGPELPRPTLASGQTLYAIDPKHTFPTFEVSHMGFSTHRGRFNKTQGWVGLDMAAKTGFIDLTIDVDSLDTGDRNLEQRLKEEDFFNTALFPRIHFTSKQLRFDGDKLVGVDGELTIRNVTKAVSLTVTAFRCGRYAPFPIEGCGADVETRIRRADFGMKAFPNAVGAEVRLIIQVEAHKR